MKNTYFNAGSIHDYPIGGGRRFTYKGHNFAVYRETYGHFYAFADERKDVERGLHRGHIEGDKLCLPSGYCVDLHTGHLEGTGKFLKSLLPWVENGFVLLSVASLLLI